MILEPDLLADFDQMISPHAPEIRIVAQQISQFGALLDQPGVGEPGDPFVKAIDTEHLAEDQAGIVEAQRLVEVGDEQILLAVSAVRFSHGRSSFATSSSIPARRKLDGVSRRMYAAMQHEPNELNE